MVYFTDTDMLESLATVNKPYKVDVKVYKKTWSWLHFTYSVIILSMATYVLDGKTARIFAEVKSARARAVKRKVWSERAKTGSETGPKGVWSLRAFRENLTPLLRVFAKPIMTKQTRLLSSLHTQ